MFCTKCGANAQPGARFCASCGAPLSVPLAATPSPMAPAHAPAGGAPAVQASAANAFGPSSLIYLFGDHFVERDTAFTAGEKLPCSEIKVKKKDLTEAMLAGAFAWLAQNGRISLSTGQKGTLIFKRTAAFVTVMRRDANDPGGLESGILHAISGNLQTDSVEDVVYRVIPNTSVDPWSDVVDIARNHLFRMGFYQEGERSGVVKFLAGRKLVPLCDRIATLQPGIGAAQALVQSFQVGNPALYRLLHDDIRKGIDSRYEAPDTDSISSSSD
ncbi:MAG: zinc ribbon domain-containing protein [Chloroflexota bacterium]|nr:zinc ribbon domain-containing protein [Chloroflexota bacterium]